MVVNRIFSANCYENLKLSRKSLKNLDGALLVAAFGGVIDNDSLNILSSSRTFSPTKNLSVQYHSGITFPDFLIQLNKVALLAMFLAAKISDLLTECITIEWSINECRLRIV